ncbi:MAG: hypothetical protein ACI8ZB_003157 [Desulforhopalus sp.]|jgi:hypothetical protein
MALFAFVRTEPNPIVEDNQLTKSLRLNRQNDFYSSGAGFDKSSSGGDIFSYDSSGISPVYRCCDILDNINSFRKFPGK